MEGSSSAGESLKSGAQETPIFQALSTYEFATDAEFQAGLASILGHSDVAPSEQEMLQRQDLVLQAQCFYYARLIAILRNSKFNLQSPVEWQAYKAWLQDKEALPVIDSLSSGAQQIQPVNTSSNISALAATTSAVQATTDAAPYPTSFSHIIDLITRNEPISGVEQIPDTVLDAKMSQPSSVPKRKKPWETDATESPPAVTSRIEPPDGVDSAQ